MKVKNLRGTFIIRYNLYNENLPQMPERVIKGLQEMEDYVGLVFWDKVDTDMVQNPIVAKKYPHMGNALEWIGEHLDEQDQDLYSIDIDELEFEE